MTERDPVEVVVRPDGLAATLRAPHGRDRSLLSPELCDSILRQAGVRESAIEWIDVEAFVEQCRHAPSDQDIEREVARGKPPIHGADGRVILDDRLTGAASKSNHDLQDAQAQRVDHHARTRFVPVLSGQAIGRVVDPTPGEDGLGVTGSPIAARPGKPPALRVHDSIERRGDELFARMNGTLDVGETIVRVVDTVEIPGFVDYTTGNIELPCDLVVDKGVRDEFVVDVRGSAHVRGLVEASTVRTGRDLTLEGGMAGRGKGEIRVGRDLHAKYLDQVRGGILRDARVAKEIVNCEFSVGRSLLSPTGQIIGGRIAVAGTCEIDSVGSEAGVPTELIIGRAPELEELLARAHDLKHRLGSRLQKSEREYEQLTKLSGPKLTASQAERSTELQYELSVLNGCASKIDSARFGLLGVVRRHATARLQVNGRIYPGVVLRIGPFTAKFRRELRGPALISLNDRGAPIVTNLLDDSIQRLKEVVPVEHDEGAITILTDAA